MRATRRRISDVRQQHHGVQPPRSRPPSSATRTLWRYRSAITGGVGSRRVARIAARYSSRIGGACRRRPWWAAERNRRGSPTWRAYCDGEHWGGVRSVAPSAPWRVAAYLGAYLGAPVRRAGAAAVDAQAARRVRRGVGGAARDWRAERHRDAAHHLKVHRGELEWHLMAS